MGLTPPLLSQSTQALESSWRSHFSASTGSMTISPSQTGQPSFPTTTRPLANPACLGGSYAINRISFSVTKTGTQAECGCARLGNTIRFDLSAYKTFITGISRNPARMQPNFGHFASLSTGDLTQPRQPTHDQTKEHDHPSSCKMHRRLLAARYFWGQFQAGANHGHSDASSVLVQGGQTAILPG